MIEKKVLENPPGVRIWITKFALTRGVYTAEEAQIEDGMAVVPQSGFPRSVVFHRPHWHLTREEAEARVAEMVKAERRSLGKKLKKLDALPAYPDAGAWAQGLPPVSGRDPENSTSR